MWNGRAVQDQWAYFLRNESAQRTLQPVLQRRLDLASRVSAPADHFKHLFFGVRLSEDAIGVGLRLSRYASIDVANLQGRAQVDGDALKAILDEIPEDITLDGVAVTPNTLLAAAGELLSGEREWLDIARRIQRKDAIAQGADLADTLGQVAQALYPLLAFILWSEENDHIGVQDEITTFAQQTEEHTAAQKAEQERKAEAAAERAEKARERTSSRSLPKKRGERCKRNGEPRRRPRNRQRMKRPMHSGGIVLAEDTAKPKPRKSPPASKRPERGKSKRPSPKKSAPKTSSPKKPKGPAPTFEAGQACPVDPRSIRRKNRGNCGFGKGGLLHGEGGHLGSEHECLRYPGDRIARRPRPRDVLSSRLLHRHHISPDRCGRAHRDLGRLIVEGGMVARRSRTGCRTNGLLRCILPFWIEDRRPMDVAQGKTRHSRPREI